MTTLTAPSERLFIFEGEDVRTFCFGEDIWFHSKDVCDVLNISKSANAVNRLDEDERRLIPLESAGGVQDTFIISESGLYSLIFRSRKRSAQEFRKWVTQTVLPEIRRTGSYVSQPVLPQNYKEALQALLVEVEKNEKLEIENKEMAPKAEIYDAAMNAKNNLKMLEVAKYFGQGRNKLFKLLREEGILMSNNMPYQRYCDIGYFKVINNAIKIGTDKNGKDEYKNIPQTLVTPKGLDLIGKVLKEKGLLVG